VRLWIDGASVGSGTAVTTTIAYGLVSKALYVGIYRGTCDLGFQGAIDDVRVWNDVPPEASAPGPVVPPVPGTPTRIPIGGHPANDDGAEPSTGSNATPRTCLRVSLNRRTVPIKRRTLVIATVRRATKRVKGVTVVLKGGGVTARARTNTKGAARMYVRARKRGRLTVRVSGQKASCPSSTVRAL
jgi:hypothetical protein